MINPEDSGEVTMLAHSLLKYLASTILCPLMDQFSHSDLSTPGFPVHHQFPELAQTHVHRVGDAIQPSPAFNFPASASFPMSQLFTSGGQNIGISTSTSVLPMNTHD